MSRSLERNAELQVQLDKAAYSGGDTIQVSIRAPYVGAGLLIIGTRPVADGAFLWRPTAGGAHLIRIVDDHGRSAERDVDVQFTR